MYRRIGEHRTHGRLFRCQVFSLLQGFALFRAGDDDVAAHRAREHRRAKCHAWFARAGRTHRNKNRRIVAQCFGQTVGTGKQRGSVHIRPHAE